MFWMYYQTKVLPIKNVTMWLKFDINKLHFESFKNNYFQKTHWDFKMIVFFNFEEFWFLQNNNINL